MLTPRLVVGRSGEAAMLAVGQGYEDDGEPYDLLARTVPYAPAGAQGEAIFTTLYLTTVTFEDAVDLFVTAIVDGVSLARQRVAIAGQVDGNPAQRPAVRELALSVPYPAPPATEQYRRRPRGTWVEVQIETRIAAGNASSTRQIVGGVAIEAEIVRESKQPAGVEA